MRISKILWLSAIKLRCVPDMQNLEGLGKKQINEYTHKKVYSVLKEVSNSLSTPIANIRDTCTHKRVNII